MYLENKRFIYNAELNLALIEDDNKGLILCNEDDNNIDNLGYKEYRLLDFSRDGRYIFLKSKKWFPKTNTNKTHLICVDLRSKEIIYSTDNFLAYRGFFDNTNTKFLLEYYDGLCLIDFIKGETLYRKDRLDKTLYNADIDNPTNKVFIPTDKKIILEFDIDKKELIKIPIKSIGKSSWIRMDNAGRILISDDKNILSCYNSRDFQKPLWQIDFSEYGPDGKIWHKNIFTTKTGLGCIQGFTNKDNETVYQGGILWIFNLNNGKIIDQFDYSKFGNQKMISVFQTDKLILDDLTSFSLGDKKIEKTKYSELIK